MSSVPVSRQLAVVRSLWLARDDYDIFADLADRLGAHEPFTEGRTSRQWLEHLYEPTRANHAHFVCENCGRVDDINYGLPPAELAAVAQAHGIDVSNVAVTFNGLCRGCLDTARADRAESGSLQD